MNINRATPLPSIAAGVDFIFKTLPRDLRVATSLGLGKPNQLLNALYAAVKSDSERSLKIYTALSLAPPTVKGDLAARFFKPFLSRQWGDDYPTLQYYADAQKDKLPPNITVHEFYFQAGTALHSPTLQRHYQSVNYTHVAENIYRDDINLILQLVAAKNENGKTRYSLSCNPDTVLDIADIYSKNNKPLVIVAVVHPDLPFLDGEAEVAPDFFAAIVESPEITHQLFALPRMPLNIEDHNIGLHASLLIADNGTLQIGIGSLSDAIVSALKHRQKNSNVYKKIAATLWPRMRQNGVRGEPATAPFVKGLHGLTEMLTDGFMHLRQLGILHREVKIGDGPGTYLQGGFILGSKPFYKWLRELSGGDARGLRMTRVSKVNDLYDPNETLLRKQRIGGHFFNTTMQMSLLGDAMSETLRDGRVVSGVGGQYNFVAMAHELQGARSVLMLRSTRVEKNGRRSSNILAEAGHVTVPRHLRDFVVTEYGVADLRGRSDEECVKSLLSITDSQFQEELLATAKKASKVRQDYKIPEVFCDNTPARLARESATPEMREVAQPFPFGSDFTPEEEHIVLALQELQTDQAQNKMQLLKNLLRPTRARRESYLAELRRMKLDQPRGFKERVYSKLLVQYLHKTSRD